MVVVRVDILVSVRTELVQRLCMVTAVYGDKISVRPDFNADQHEVDVLLMIQL